ncbi:MAG: coproporphyrinogen dehydrogenase HemZ [Phascolarctobacterium sp.]|nr:coproporphyrinogen dehydrogenase HemZ [Phascolarctobacterium sp.]
MNTFALINHLDLDITRAVSDMARYYDFASNKFANVKVIFTQETGLIKAELSLDDGTTTFFVEKPNEALAHTSGEINRCVKLLSLKVFGKLAGKTIELPWGILTGVRPTKLVHKLMDDGAENPAEYLQNKYLLSPSNANLLCDIAKLQKNLLADEARFEEAGIYIGIPFCPSRCTYCSFPSGIIPQDEESQQNFLNFIEQDIQNVVQLLGMRSISPTSLYIGGGTPTSFAEKPFARLMELCSKYFNLPSIKEFTVEAGRPDCFSVSKLQAMESVGVNRVSVNPQTFHDATLKTIGRNHTVNDFYKAYDLVRASSIPIVNMDLIIGLPGESEKDIEFSLHEAKRLAPENLTIHTLTLKKSAPLFGSKLSLEPESASRMVKRGLEIAHDLGMVPYYLYRQHYMLGHLANIGYALPGTESIYNVQMMEERHPIIGIGPSSASKMPLPDGHHLAKLNMPKNIRTYEENLQVLFEKRRETLNSISN